MNALRFIAVLSVCGLMATACGTPAKKHIDNAEQNLAAGDVEAARIDAEHLATSADTADLCAADLCRLAMVYASVGEDSLGNEGDVAMAARCIRRAIAKDSAAVDSFIHALPLEQRALMSLAVQLCHTHRSGDIVDYEQDEHMTDSI